MRVGLFKSSGAGSANARESKIRGKISGPIPIPTADDEEFPMRRQETAPANLAGHDGVQRSLVPPEGSTRGSQVTAGSPERAREETIGSTAQRGLSQASETSGSPARQHTTRSSTLRYSTTSRGTDTDMSRGTPQRKKSMLRSTLSKLFGRKKKSTSGDFDGLDTHPEAPATPVQHGSNPSVLGRIANKEGEAKRSVSLPITEYDRALRSHSIGPNDIIAIESARNSYTGETIKYRRRAATTSSKLYTTKSRDFGDLAGLSPRPASAHLKGSENVLGDDDPENIGRAITSDIFMQHRRSRSLSQLGDAAVGQTQRNRSEEIKYWRQSYDPGFHSPTSSQANDFDHTGNVSIDNTPLPAETRPRTPPQPFNFGPLIGMKITEAASLEDRMAALELHNSKLERLVKDLFHVVPGAKTLLDTPERYRPISGTYNPSPPTSANPALYQVRAEEMRQSSSRQSNESFGDSHTFVNSGPPPAMIPNRPTSTATIRGATSLPSLSREAAEPFTSHQYTTLLALLETERAARQALEAQVMKLNNKLNLALRNPKKLEVRTDSAELPKSVFDHDDDENGAEWPGGDPDELSESEPFETPREERQQQEFGAFGEQLLDEEADESRKKAARTLSLSRLTLGKPSRPAAAAEVQL
ncbi:hypothetical protein BX600DRAFT_507947 [Xylariales sp. PMI_506]|nr:hypothetical protein BX600DRAFT_507947 [Xylariales sp. PMI_506]